MTQKLYIIVLSLVCALALTWCEANDASLPIPKDGEPPVLYSNQIGDPLRNLFSESMDRAKKSIFIIIYSLTDPVLIEKLKNKAENGIEVNVVYDPKASPKLRGLLGTKIKFHPRMIKALMHQKIMIIDEEETWIGSANMTGESLKMHGNLVTVIRSHEVAKIALEKAWNLTQFSAQPILHRKFIVGEQPLEMWFLPDDPQAISRVKELIRGAKKTIKIAMFTWTRFDLANEIINAKKRGVDVEIILDQNAANGAGEAIVNLLDKNHISLKVNEERPLVHYKFAWIDDTTLINGSANWTKAAFTQNDDCFIVLEELNLQQQEVLKKLWRFLQNNI